MHILLLGSFCIVSGLNNGDKWFVDFRNKVKTIEEDFCGYSEFRIHLFYYGSLL